MDTVVSNVVGVTPQEKLRGDVAKAEEISRRLMEQRKQAPSDYVFGRVFADEAMDAMVKRLVPGAESDPSAKRDGTYMPGATVSAAWFTEREHAEKVSYGYIPVVESDGSHARFKEMLLYKRPIEFMRDEVRAYRGLSRERVASTRVVGRELNNSDGQGGDVTDNTLTVTDKKIRVNKK